ncbi:MAG: hypothetical protein AAF715_08010 [Myxococcota bacterium]
MAECFSHRRKVQGGGEPPARRGMRGRTSSTAEEGASSTEAS